MRLVRAAAAAQAERLKAGLASALWSLVLVTIAVVVLSIGVGFSVSGVYASLAERLPAWQAGGLVGVAALFLGLLLLLIAWPVRSRGRRPLQREPRQARHDRESDVEAVAGMGEAAGRAARDLIRDRRPGAMDIVLGAFVIGLVASRSRGWPGSGQEAGEDGGSGRVPER